MTGEIDLKVFAQQIRTAADGAGASLVRAAPGAPNPESVLTVAMDPDEMARVIKATSPKIVYLNERVFSVKEDIDEQVQERMESVVGRGWKVTAPGGIDKLRRKYYANKNELCQIIVGFVVDGVYHMNIVETAWLSVLREELKSVLDQWQQQLTNAQGIEVARETADIDAKATELAKQPAFNAHPQSFENRRFLAATMFPELSDEIVHRIATLAARKSWLAKAGGIKTK